MQTDRTRRIPPSVPLATARQDRVRNDSKLPSGPGRHLAALKWWLPGPVTVVSLITLIGWYWAVAYYSAYYRAFGLDIRQVGLSKMDILVRLLPIGVAFMLVGALVHASILVLRTPLKSKDPRKRKSSKSASNSTMRVSAEALKEAAKDWSIVVPLLAIAALVGVMQGVARDAGRHDAKRFVTSPYQAYYQSSWEFIFETTAGVSEIRWVGPPEENILKNLPSVNAKDPHTLARIISTNGEITAYLDLYTCDVHLEPTIDLAINYGLTDYTSGAPATLPMKSCPSTIR